MSAMRDLGVAPAAASMPATGAPFAVAAPPDVLPCLETAACTSGQLSDGTPYQFVKPDQWNGVVLVDMDFADGGPGTPLTGSLVQRGYAVGGTTRAVAGWRIARAIDNQAAALGRFETAFGPTRWATAEGRSMGGFAAAGAAQVHPGLFDAAVRGSPRCPV